MFEELVLSSGLLSARPLIDLKQVFIRSICSICMSF
jgi:hypothetical protein